MRELQICKGTLARYFSLIPEPETFREASLFWMARFDEKERPKFHDQLKNALASMMLDAQGQQC
jgi:hypothetical protein